MLRIIKIVFKILVSCVLLTSPIRAQDSDDTLIFWDKNYKLQFEDFRGKVPLHVGLEVAATGTHIKVIGFWEDNMPNFSVEVYFLKNSSWIKDSTNKIIKHEQLHFDISELTGRKIRKGVLELRKGHQNNLEDYQQLIKALLEYHDAMNIQYDNETAHGIYEKEQAEWELKISKELKELSDYEIDYSQ